MSIDAIVRPEIATLKAYVTAEQVSATVRLNANEAPHSPWQPDTRDGLNRYPEIRPQRLEARLAQLFDTDPAALLATRGSSEAIDALIRAFCRPYTDNIVVTPPTFSMYRVYADVQAAETINVPLRAEQDFALDTDAVLEACTPETKLVFICSPNNPTGALVSRNDILALVQSRAGQSLVVVDEAYLEFSGARSVADEIGRNDNLVVLRTLSKAWGLAGVRCGALIAAPEVVGMLERVIAPYSFSTPATDCLLETLESTGVADARQLVKQTIAERGQLEQRLARLDCVRHIWHSDSNFLLVQ
ncbi:MAG: histidinol-phosphate transaminase, partial [Woeseia sp.]